MRFAALNKEGSEGNPLSTPSSRKGRPTREAQVRTHSLHKISAKMMDRHFCFKEDCQSIPMIPPYSGHNIVLQCGTYWSDHSSWL